MIDNLSLEELQWIVNCTIAVIFILILVIAAYLKNVTTRPPKL